MTKIKWWLIASLIIIVMVLPLLSACGEKAEGVLYIGGTMSLTGAYAEDTAAVLAGYEDYAEYVNETHKLAPWRDEKLPSGITLEVM